jgi:hypothetical protein
MISECLNWCHTLESLTHLIPFGSNTGLTISSMRLWNSEASSYDLNTRAAWVMVKNAAFAGVFAPE